MGFDMKRISIISISTTFPNEFEIKEQIIIFKIKKRQKKSVCQKGCIFF